ncbi:hypothetical protein BDZ94DRAFT_1299760 [Collybia nuda]|uniref:DUF6534 domain-containing protein n=1 Tax=Collybia nuda TaxID=64659 RepID=A0A9P6CH81_9AGAR|nr:hypothetical protein BDZ94DRAFT_1299760 [Collybia nuda]
MTQLADGSSTQVTNIMFYHDSSMDFLMKGKLVGYLLSWRLYGTLSLQVYIYYLAFPRDRLPFKFLFYGVYTIETLHAVRVAHDIFSSFVDGFGDFKELSDIRMTWFTMPTLSGVVAFCVQIFYAFRLITLSKSRVVGSIIFLMAVVLFTGALISGIEGARAGNLLKLTSRLEYVGNGLFDITSGACDIVIAIYMASYLSRQDNGFLKSTHAIMSKIIRLVVGTGALTVGGVNLAAVAIINALESLDSKEWFLASDVVLGRLYSNSMMVIFNNRVNIMGGRGESAPFMIDFEPSGSDSTLEFSRRPEQDSLVMNRRTSDARSIFSTSKEYNQQVVNLCIFMVIIANI